MVESFHYFSFKVCLLGLLVNMYIFKLSKNYNKSLFQVLIYSRTLIFESFDKYFHEEILVVALFFLFLSLSLGAYYEEMEINSWKKRGFFPQPNHSQTPLLVLQQLLSFEIFEFIFVAYFQGLNYLIISCFSHKFPSRISINWRWIFKNKEIFFS